MNAIHLVDGQLNGEQAAEMSSEARKLKMMNACGELLHANRASLIVLEAVGKFMPMASIDAVINIVKDAIFEATGVRP